MASRRKADHPNYSGDWYRKYTSPTGGVCSTNAVSAGTKTYTLTTLSPGTTYTYAAYSDSGCTNLLTTATAFTTHGDYDADDDGLIKVKGLAQFNAIHWDLAGNGTASRGNTTGYAAAFPDAESNMGCNEDDTNPAACSGYELTANLDFGTNGNGSADSGDTYWNSGAGWSPIGTWGSHFTATFGGHGYSYILDHIAPRMLSRGFTPEGVHDILVSNPAEVLTFR